MAQMLVNTSWSIWAWIGGRKLLVSRRESAECIQFNGDLGSFVSGWLGKMTCFMFEVEFAMIETQTASSLKFHVCSCKILCLLLHEPLHDL
jgi:hypothetical protein